ncbi:MAG TPA: glutaredoxin family protein [Janthinobacterium sp.]|nr:glutaredoxin family protein [Janthinobacterium sp.]
MNFSTRCKLGLVLLLCAGAASAQMYKWKDAKGVTHFSDTPPPPSAAANVEVKSYAGGSAQPELPFELAEAVKSHPVTLYTMRQCDACEQGRAMLRARGIPYSEKTVNTADDTAALKKAGGGDHLPMLLVGRTNLSGFEAGAWNNALTAAAYPTQSMLPTSYRQASGTPAAPPRQPSAEAQAKAAAKAAAAEAKRNVLPPIKQTPDFQF